MWTKYFQLLTIRLCAFESFVPAYLFLCLIYPSISRRKLQHLENGFFLRHICLPNCLKVVWKLSVPEYILTLKTGEYCLRTALVRRGYSTAKPYFTNTLNIFMKHFSRQIFLVCPPPSFCRVS